MIDLTITLESTCDLPRETIKEYNLDVIDMDFLIGEEKYNTATDDVVTTNLYQKMREGQKTSTSQINQTNYYEFFEKELQKGKPILHLAFSSGLSNTYLSSKQASEEINAKYGKKVYVIDTICACSGHGVIAIMARRLANQMDSLDELVDKIESIKLKLKHDFSVDNLKYLANGGRIKSSSAFIGNILNIKPVMKTDDEGKLVVCGKVISRKKSLNALVDDFVKTYDSSYDICYIAHADCLEDAVYMANLIKEKTGVNATITNLGPIIGCHSGPGTISLYFFSDKR